MPNLYALKDHKKESQLHFNRILVCIIVMSCLILMLIGRLIFLQIVQHDLYKTLSLNNQVRIVPITPTRGLIYDRNGVLLAENIPAFSLEITPERTLDIEWTLNAIDKIMPITDVERKRFYKQLKYKRHHQKIPIRVKLTETEVAKFSVEKHRIPGVEIIASLIRHYPAGDQFAHALGYVGPISEKDLKEIDPANYHGTYYIGKIGLEKFYEKILHGKTGYQHVEADAKGRVIRVLKRIAPTPGSNLHLSLDHRLQKMAIHALQDLKGAIVAIEPKTGEVLALVSNPSFDPNLFIQGIDVDTYSALQNSPDRPLFNRAIKGQYPPGSTLKPAVALRALELGIIDPRYQIFDPGWYQINGTGRLYRDWIYFSKQHGHGWMDLAKAISQSCDTYFYMLAPKLGIKNLHDIYTRFGLGTPTQIDIPGEAAGLVPSAQWKQKTYNEAWYPGDTLNVIIGQGRVLATPMQMAQFTAILANKGKSIKPKFVHAIHNAHLDLVTEQPLQAIQTVTVQKEKNWDIIIDAMQKVVHIPGGTAYRISQGLSYQIAAKTGTAQVFNLKQNEKYKANRIKAHLRDHSWFIAFAPAKDPKIAIAVIIENKLNKAAADIARTVLDDFFNSKSTLKTLDVTGEDESEVGGEGNME